MNRSTAIQIALVLIILTTLPLYSQTQTTPRIAIYPHHQSIAQGSTFTFYIWRNGDISKPLTINYSVGGNAEPGIDYYPRVGPVGYMSTGIFPAGVSLQTITIQTFPAVFDLNPYYQPNRPAFFTFMLLPGNGYEVYGGSTTSNVGIWTGVQYQRQCQLGWASNGCPVR